MNPSGTWTTYRGERRRVSGRADLDSITLQVGRPHEIVLERVPATEVGDVVKIVTRARWRESLYGDQTSGWRGVARVDDLSDVREESRLERAGGGA